MRILVANRGEIAVRILTAARELEWETYAVYTENDTSHTYYADHAIQLPSPASYLDIDHLIKLAKGHKIEAIHPGYGFLSESADFARRMQDEAGIPVIGPGYDILQRTGDKLQARLLAEECNVPVLPALTEPTSDATVVQRFASDNGFPIMIKAVDGGGGRGIRLVNEESELEAALRRAIEESPSKAVFVEKAAISDYRHVEIQVIGDNHGNVTHLWERECSIQRRYQKVVELAPSTIIDRRLVAQVIESALKMADKIRYKSLGTFEFLVNPQSQKFFFLEVNPRLQVEHTITESICQIDIVMAQLLIFRGASLHDLDLTRNSDTNHHMPKLRSLQLRITAEDPQKNWSLSIGKIQSFHFPQGNGIRVDTNLVSGLPATVTTDFDSLLAKIIVTAPTWEGLLQKAKRALRDTRITGIQTNIPILSSILSHADFIAGQCDTRWLETHQSALLATSQPPPPSHHRALFASAPAQTTSLPNSSQLLLKKDDSWTITLSPTPSSATTKQQTHHIHLLKINQNNFPHSLTGRITHTLPSQQPQTYNLSLASTTSSSASASSNHRLGDAANKDHVIVPFAGKLIEVSVDEGDVVQKGDVIAVVRQMKMEVEVRAHRRGRVVWVFEGEEGEDVGEGVLVAVLEDEQSEGKRGREIKL